MRRVQQQNRKRLKVGAAVAVAAFTAVLIALSLCEDRVWGALDDESPTSLTWLCGLPSDDDAQPLRNLDLRRRLKSRARGEEDESSDVDIGWMTAAFVGIVVFMACSSWYFWKRKRREEQNVAELGSIQFRVMQRKGELQGGDLDADIAAAEARVAEAEQALSIAAADGTYDNKAAATRANANTTG